MIELIFFNFQGIDFHNLLKMKSEYLILYASFYIIYPCIINACNERQFGKSCSLPLGANCPWKSPLSVPLMYILSYNGTSIINKTNYTKYTIIKVGNMYNNTNSPICQVIFPFPLSLWLSLESKISSSDFSNLMRKIPEDSCTGEVNDITNIKSIAAISDNSGFVRTYIGKVWKSYGYYIYNSPNRQPWVSMTNIYIPNIIFNLIPKINRTKLEYSFYGSEAYCKIQYVNIT